jgi:hypothetical protein
VYIYEYLFALPEDATGRYAMAASTKGDDYVRAKDFVPNDFRFDLSCQNKNQEIYVEKIIFNFRNETFTISNEDIDKYLGTNDEVVFNLATRTYTFKEAKKGPYDPFLKTTGQFYPLLEKLVGYEAFPHQQQ